VQQTYIEEFTDKWGAPSLILFDEVYDVLKNDLSVLVQEHFGKMGRGGALHSVLYVHLALFDTSMLTPSFPQDDSERTP
jgi:hypothetical protein